MERTPRSVSELVEERVRSWLLQKEIRDSLEKGSERPRPIVTLSREAGAHGTDIGRRVAALLGFRLWDQELVQRIAEETGALTETLAAIDERDRNAIEELLAGIFIGDQSSAEGYMTRLLGLIHAIALRGSAVVIGRGAQYVVQPESAFRVRVVSPLRERVRTLEVERKWSERHARSEIERIDRERRAFIRHHYGQDATEPSTYDLVVNSSTLAPDRAADVVVFGYRSKFPLVITEATGRPRAGTGIR